MTAHPNLSPVAHSWLLLTVFPHCHQPCDLRVVCAVDWEHYGCIQAVSPCGEQNKGPPLQKTGTGPVFCWLRGYTPWIEAETYVSIRSSWFHKSQCLWIWCTHKCFNVYVWWKVVASVPARTTNPLWSRARIQRKTVKWATCCEHTLWRGNKQTKRTFRPNNNWLKMSNYPNLVKGIFFLW